MRRSFYDDLNSGRCANLADSVRRMRKITGLTQKEYAGLIGIAPRVLIDLERGVGNPTLKTLIKMASPFGLDIGFVKRNDKNNIIIKQG